MTHYLAVLDEPLRQAHHVEDRQRAGMDADSPGLQGRPVALVDDTGAYPPGQQFRREHKPGRAGADDQDLAVRAGTGRNSVHAANSAPAAAPEHLRDYVGATYLPPAGPPHRPRPPAGSG